MTPAERQQRHRLQNVTAPMTKAEREELSKLLRQRERVLKSAARQRSTELMAEFERQMAAIYSWDSDAVWKAAAEAAQAAVTAAQAEIAARCAEIGIPERFGPSIEMRWYGRGENAVKERRNELRKVAQTRIAAIEQAAIVQIEVTSVEAQTRVTASGLSSEGALTFFETLPRVEDLMPSLEFASVENLLENSKKLSQY
jgi:hypothetical protein